jgi:ABC-type branched-subunit amino acid transport system substrate-binding protein
VSAALLLSLFAQSGLSARKSKDLDSLKEIETLASQGRTDEAIAAYQSFVKDYPKSDYLGAAYLAMGKLYITKKDYDQALKAFSHVIAASKQSSEKEEASLLTGKIYFTQKKYQDANDSLQGVFKNARDQKMKTEMANVLFQSNRQLGKYQQAVFWLGQYSLAAEPKDAERARAVLPDILPKLSDEEIAQTLKAEGPDWLKGELTFTLGKRYFEEGKTDESKELMETLLKKYRDSPKREEAGNLLALIDKMSKVETGRIGLILPLSGPYQSFGERALKGATLAANIFGNKETDSKIELRVVNADSDPQAAIDAVKKMVAEDNIVALVGPITNLNAAAVADLAQELGLPMIALSPSPELAKKGNFVFRDCLTKQVQVNALLDWAMNVKKLKKFAMIYPEDKYGTEFADLFDKQVQERGGSLIKKVAYSEGETDFRDQVQSLMRGKAWDFDALFIPDSWEAVDLIVPQVLYFKIDTQLLGPSGWHSPKLFDQIRPNYVEGAAVVDLFAPELKSEEFEKYQYNYQQAFQENPSLVDAQAYEAVSLLIDLLSHKDVTSRKTLADALSKVDSWTGPLGTIKINPDGEVSHQITLFKIHKGEFEPVK